MRFLSTPTAYFEIGLGHFKQSLIGNQAALPKARQAWQLGAEQGLTNCQNALGGLHLKEGDVEKAQFYFKQAADNGHVRAATELGKIFFTRLEQARKVLPSPPCSSLPSPFSIISTHCPG